MMTVRPMLLVALCAVLGGDLTAQQESNPIKSLLARPVDAARVLRAGEIVRGELKAEDPYFADSTHLSLWYFRAKAGERVTVTQSSTVVDTYLRVGRAGGDALIVENDDADGTDSEVNFTAPADGDYVVMAGTFDAKSTGNFFLKLAIREPAPGFTGPATPALVMAREVDPMQRLGLGQRFSSQIDARDGKMADGSSFELWYVSATAGETLEFTVESTEIPVILSVGMQGSGTVLANASDARRAVLRVTAASNGTFAIVVQSGRNSAYGSFALEVNKVAR